MTIHRYVRILAASAISMDQVNFIRIQALFIFSVLPLAGCSGATNIYDLKTVPSHWHNYCCSAGHGTTGELVSTQLPLRISYDRNWMGSREIKTNPLTDLSYEEKMVDGELVRILLKRKDYLIVSFPNSMQNFFAEVNEEHEIDYIKKLLLRYRHDLLAVEYERGTECFRPSKHPISSNDEIAYYECLTVAKPERIDYLSALGYAYLSSLIKGERRWQEYEFKGGSDFQVLAKVDSVANLLLHTKDAQDAVRMRATSIHLVADYILREKDLEATLNYVDRQLTKYATDTLLTKSLRRERQKLIDHTQEIKEGKYIYPSRVSW